MLGPQRRTVHKQLPQACTSPALADTVAGAAQEQVERVGADPMLHPFCADDSWLTVGITGGDSNQQIGSVGLSWSDWTSHKGINDNDCGVFWMNPLKANQSASYEHNPIMLGQLTVLKSYNGNVTFGLKGKHHGNEDWRQEGVSFSLGDAQASGSGSWL